MRYFDYVRVLNDKYEGEGVKKGQIGIIFLAEIRDNTFYVYFDENDGCIGDELPIKIEDLEVVKSSNIENYVILRNLPAKNPKWWCIVEDGYIKNLLGEKKNKIPYDYES